MWMRVLVFPELLAPHVTGSGIGNEELANQMVISAGSI